MAWVCFPVFVFPSFRQVHKKCPSAFVPGCDKKSTKRLSNQRPSNFRFATNQEGRGVKKRKVARGQSENQINQIFLPMKPRVKLSLTLLGFMG